MGAASGRMEEIDAELTNIQEQLGQAKVDKHESSRAMKKAELLENLKRLFPGVVSVWSALWHYMAHFLLHSMVTRLEISLATCSHTLLQFHSRKNVKR